jgi:hypothetical protein
MSHNARPKRKKAAKAKADRQHGYRRAERGRRDRLSLVEKAWKTAFDPEEETKERQATI